MTFWILNHPVIGGTLRSCFGPRWKRMACCTTCGLGSAGVPVTLDTLNFACPFTIPWHSHNCFQLLPFDLFVPVTSWGCRLRDQPLYWGKLKLLQSGFVNGCHGFGTMAFPIKNRRTRDVEESGNSNSSNTKLSEEEQVRRIHVHVNKLIKTGGNNKSNPSNAKVVWLPSIVVSWLTNSWKRPQLVLSMPSLSWLHFGLHRHPEQRFSWIRFVVTWPPWWKWRKWAWCHFETALPRAEEAGVLLVSVQWPRMILKMPLMIMKMPWWKMLGMSTNLSMRMNWLTKKLTTLNLPKRQMQETLVTSGGTKCFR